MPKKAKKEIKTEDAAIALAAAGGTAAAIYFLLQKPTPKERIRIDSVDFVVTENFGAIEIKSAEFVPTVIPNQGTVSITSAEFIPTTQPIKGEVVIDNADFIAF